jgi:hypothetical protein
MVCIHCGGLQKETSPGGLTFHLKSPSILFKVFQLVHMQQEKFSLPLSNIITKSLEDYIGEGGE